MRIDKVIAFTNERVVFLLSNNKNDVTGFDSWLLITIALKSHLCGLRVITCNFSPLLSPPSPTLSTYRETRIYLGSRLPSGFHINFHHFTIHPQLASEGIHTLTIDFHTLAYTCVQLL